MRVLCPTSATAPPAPHAPLSSTKPCDMPTPAPVWGREPEGGKTRGSPSKRAGFHIPGSRHSSGLWCTHSGNTMTTSPLTKSTPATVMASLALRG